MLPKLLLIEDNPSISKIQRHVALRIGYQVDIADSLASAIDLIEVNDYFSSNCVLELRAYTSASKKEEANDAGSGLGGKWTTHFFAKG